MKLERPEIGSVCNRVYCYTDFLAVAALAEFVVPAETEALNPSEQIRQLRLL